MEANIDTPTPHEPEVILESPEEGLDLSSSQEQVEQQQEIIPSSDRKRLLRHISILLNHPVMGKHLEGFKEYQYSTLSEEDLAMVIEEMEDCVRRTSESGIVTHVVRSGLRTIESLSSMYPQMGIRLQGLCDQHLQIDNPESPFSLNMYLVSAQIESGHRLSPLQGLGISLLAAVAQCHYTNTNAIHQAVDERMKATADEELMELLEDEEEIEAKDE